MLLGMTMPVAIALSLPSNDDMIETNLPPPSGRETYRELLPALIGGEPPTIRTLPPGSGLVGARAVYGMHASIDIVLATRASDLDAFVREHVRARLEAYETRSSGKIDGIWKLRGHGRAGRLHGWQNRLWLFVIEARDDALFDEVVDRFAFVERKRGWARTMQPSGG